MCRIEILCPFNVLPEACGGGEGGGVEAVLIIAPGVVS